MTTVLIADDQALVRVGLRKILESEADTTVVGEAADGGEAVDLARTVRPDVVLMDIRMPVLDGIEATRRIVRDRPEARVLILTTFGLDEYVFEALRAGEFEPRAGRRRKPAQYRRQREGGHERRRRITRSTNSRSCAARQIGLAADVAVSGRVAWQKRSSTSGPLSLSV
jgi:chemotaxis response regulator CheB